MAKGLYTRDEIACMTKDALDELLSHYADTGNTEGMQRVMDEVETRWDDEQDDEPPVEDYDPGPECDDEGGMSEVEWPQPI